MESENDLDKRRNDAAARFLAAVTRYQRDGKRDGDFIVNEYLKKFDGTDPLRSPTAIKIAEETRYEIESFGTDVGDLSFKVNMVLMSSESETLSATTASIDTALKHLATFLDDVSSSLLNRDGRSIPSASTEDLDNKLSIIRDDLKRKIELGIFTVNAATDIINSRCDTLRDFSNDNLYASRELFISRLRAVIEKSPEEAAFETFKNLAQKILDEVLENAPGIRWLFWAKKKLDKIVTPAGTKPGDTDIMLNLLPELNKTTELFKELEISYQNILEQK